MPPPVARVRPNWTPADWRGDGRATSGPGAPRLAAGVGGSRCSPLPGRSGHATDCSCCWRRSPRKATAEMEDGTQVDDDAKSEAGKRPNSLPPALHADIEVHLARFAEHGPYGRRFVGPLGGVPRRRNFNRVWKRAPTDAGIPADLGLHPHHLRYTGSTWSAQSGATPKLGSATPARGRRWYTSTRHATAIRLSRLHSTP